MGELAHLEEQLKRLGLHTMATLLEGEVDKATKSQMSYTGFLERLVEEELVAKTDRSINQRIAKARFPALKTLEGFDFSFQPSLPVTLVKELARLDFLGRGENVVAVGPPGTGKPTQQPALIDTTVFNLETIKVVDPTHPLFGRRLPLVSVTTIQGLRHACLVRLEGGVERTIPIEATDLGASPLPVWPSPLSLKALCALLAVYLEVTIVEGEGHVTTPEGSAARLGVGPLGSAPASSGAGGDGPNHEGGVGP
jgi:hypothetical protein